MTIVLKSNSVAKNKISDPHGVIGVSDWRLMFDFENEQYYRKTSEALTKLTLADCISSVNINPMVISKNNEYIILKDNSPRLSFNPSLKAFGLLEEATNTNYYYPSEAPINKTISLVEGETGPWIVRMKGAGSVRISGASVINQNPASSTATEVQPLVFRCNSPGAVANIAVEVIGDVKQLAIIGSGFGPNNCTANTVPRTQFSTWWFSSGVTKVLNARINEVISAKKDFTVIFQCIDNEFLNVPIDGSIYKPLIEMINQAKHISVIKRKLNNQTEEIAVRLFNNSEIVIPLRGTNPSNTIAISSGSNGLIFAIDGIVTNASQTMNDFTISDILIGSSTQWLSSFDAKAQGVFTKFAIFDRQLSNDELSKISRSFQ